MSNPTIFAVIAQCTQRGFDYESIEANHCVSWNNSKLKQDGIASFNLPPVSTCPGKGACESWCYATQGMQWMASGYKKRVGAFKATLLPDFPEVMVAHLVSERVKILRIHDSGDFYSPQYLMQWIEISTKLPTVLFYAYTKQIVLVQKMAHLIPPNLKLIQSLGGKFDHLIDHSKPHAKIFSNLEELLTAGYTDTSESDLPAATIGVDKIGLVIHGVKKKKFNTTEQSTKENDSFWSKPFTIDENGVKQHLEE